MGVSLLISTTDSNSNKKNYMMRGQYCYVKQRVLIQKYVTLVIFYLIILNIFYQFNNTQYNATFN